MFRKAVASAVRTMTTSTTAGAAAAPAGRLMSTATASEVAKVCKPAPSFSCKALLPDGSFGTVSLSDYKDKWVVLFTYPLAFTFTCPTEIIAFSEKAEEFKKLGAHVLAASVDSHFTEKAWVETPRSKGGLGKINVPILADIDRKLGTAYGCLLDTGFHCRATYIIDNKGIIRHLSMNDPPVGRSVDEVLRLVQAYQYTDTHGEVCPANWKKGDKTINPAKANEYFEAVNKE